ncbi:hypothetical protein [Photobacterium damselae]|uniref:hypothetical protein n=1 Tax=Photobacterium damselae TaxID=38293 RepID=UPI001F32F2B6|nr:hypothetical protein [Photobacterium damselae]UKA00685.1 hypothetical protein IHC89_08085 [Photobacterium damselae subsp. damselae]
MNIQIEEQNQFLEKLYIIKQELPVEYESQHRRINEYKEDYQQSIGFLNSSKRVAFIGDVGKGKTTAICCAFGLSNPSDSTDLLLSHSSGRTTICEVEIIPNSDINKIEIIPYKNKEIVHLLKDYSKNIFNKAHPVTTEDRINANAINEGFALSEELEKAFRNMLGLSGSSLNERSRLIQNDVKFASAFTDYNDMYRVMESKLELHKRTDTVLESPKDTVKKVFKWTKDTFKNINVGKIDTVSLPRKIIIHLMDDFVNYNIVDTKGLDGTTNRRDINQCLESDVTVNVICSSFNDAPDQSMRKIIEQMIKGGRIEDLYTKTILLIIDKQKASSRVANDDGEPVNDKSYGRAIRIGQVLNDLEQKYGLDGDRLNVVCYDAFDDKENVLLDSIQDKLSELELSYKTKVELITKGVTELIDEQNSQSFDIAKKALLDVFSKWFNDAENFTTSVDPLHTSLINEINITRAAATIRASVARRGHWHNLDMYETLAQQAKFGINQNKAKLFNDFDCLIDSCIENPQLRKVYNISVQLKQVAQRFRQKELMAVYEQSIEFYNNDFYYASNMWNSAQDEWGKGKGYKGRVVNHIRNHFSNEQRKYEKQLEHKSNQRWKQFLKNIKSML